MHLNGALAPRVQRRELASESRLHFGASEKPSAALTWLCVFLELGAGVTYLSAGTHCGAPIVCAGRGRAEEGATSPLADAH